MHESGHGWVWVPGAYAGLYEGCFGAIGKYAWLNVVFWSVSAGEPCDAASHGVHALCGSSVDDADESERDCDGLVHVELGPRVIGHDGFGHGEREPHDIWHDGSERDEDDYAEGYAAFGQLGFYGV